MNRLEGINFRILIIRVNFHRTLTVKGKVVLKSLWNEILKRGVCVEGESKEIFSLKKDSKII